VKAEFLQPFRPLRCPETSLGHPRFWTQHGGVRWGMAKIWESGNYNLWKKQDVGYNKEKVEINKILNSWDE
jgi:hypothetical protein